MVKKDNSPPIFDEVKKELDPMIEEGIKWIEDNTKESTETYKQKQKEYETKVNPIMQKLYAQQPESTDPSGVKVTGAQPDGFTQEFAKEAFARADAEKNKETNLEDVD